MKKSVLLLFSLAVTINAQLRLNIDTDKDVYEYGENIKIYCTLHNDADTSVSFLASNYNTCQAEFILNDFYSTNWEACLPTVEEINFPPHSERIYSWTIEPHILGIPDKDGEQILIGYFNQGWNSFNTEHLKDTTTFTSPIFLGGQLNVGFNLSVEQKADSIREEYNAEVLARSEFSGKVDETWEITDIQIDSVYHNLQSNSTFYYVEYNRSIKYDSIFVTSVKKIDDLKKEFALSQNYPNPFNPSTTIKFTISSIGAQYRASQQHTKLIVYDILGREVRTLMNKKLSPGSYEVEFNGNDLSSGIYLYKLQYGKMQQTRKMILLK